MRTKAAGSLANLRDADFFDSVANGLRLIGGNASRFSSAAKALAGGGHGRGSHALEIIASEEAAKYLILVDGVRCPRSPQERRARHLSRFYDQLAKGIYVETAGTRPASYAEILRFIDNLREEYYLDGPNGFDWIFSNDILRTREQALYVDYVESDGNADWWSPGGIHDDDRFGRWQVSSAAVQLVGAMMRIGFADAAVLSRIADVWRPLNWTPESSYEDLKAAIVATEQRCHATEDTSACWGMLVSSWVFPLYHADLQKIPVKLANLKQEQEARMWSELL
jgi:hypothetical protein